ncbi:MAG: glutamate 5-kinase [Candidatus Omnitrophota bacterium]|nr:glutamate 5-kinase [Candidatus Omnitrophota bacterium]
MQKHKRIVVKIGTKVITSKDGMLDKGRLRELVRQMARIKSNGPEVILVTSGAIGTGMGLLGIKKRPVKLPELQAAAAIGQSHLMHFYSKYFHMRRYRVGQILLTREDFNDRKRYSNIKSTIQTLLKHKVVPIINENDTVSTEEIKFGDNDHLALLVGKLCGADKLVLLTDVDGLLDENCGVISVIEKITPKILRLGRSSKCELGTGGMVTKLLSVKGAAESGVECVIANGKSKDVLIKILDGKMIGSTFRAMPSCHCRESGNPLRKTV